MSGGVGLVPNEAETQQKLQNDDLQKNQTNSVKEVPLITGTTTSRRRGFWAFWQLNSLAIIIVLSASAMVDPTDVAFVVFTMIYFYFLSKVAFPRQNRTGEALISFGKFDKLLAVYEFFGAATGIFLPIAYIFEGILEGDKEGIIAAIPHVFLLASQVFTDGVFSSGFSEPIRVLVPILYNSRRLLTILDWLFAEMAKGEQFGKGGGGARRLYIGRGLAVGNLALWGFNLFGFLLPVCLPKAFKQYYCHGDGDKITGSEKIKGI